MGYVHIEIDTFQASKKEGAPCGDVVHFERSPGATTIIVSDGLGHGIKANIAATMCVARLSELLKCGFSMRQAFTSLVKTMNLAAKENLPYAVFTVARILNDGVTTILSYQMPPPMLISKRFATALNQRTFTVEKSVIGEANCYLNDGEAIVIVSDGITQAGLGKGMKYGWEIDGVCKYVNSRLVAGSSMREIPEEVFKKSFEICKGNNDDDSTVVLAYTRIGQIVNVLSGPPIKKDHDKEVVDNFIKQHGTKIVCGGTTASIVSKHTGKNLIVDNTFANHFTPPSYKIDDIDLVTEGAVTLNQFYNIIDEDRVEMDDDNPATKLYDYMLNADRINFFVGANINPATHDIRFIQQGLVARHKIIPVIAAKLRELGKLVVEEDLE